MFYTASLYSYIEMPHVFGRLGWDEMGRSNLTTICLAGGTAGKTEEVTIYREGPKEKREAEVHLFLLYCKSRC